MLYCIYYEDYEYKCVLHEMLFHIALLLITACGPEENRPEENYTAD